MSLFNFQKSYSYSLKYIWKCVLITIKHVIYIVNSLITHCDIDVLAYETYDSIRKWVLFKTPSPLPNNSSTVGPPPPRSSLDFPKFPEHPELYGSFGILQSLAHL